MLDIGGGRAVLNSWSLMYKAGVKVLEPGEKVFVMLQNRLLVA